MKPVMILSPDCAACALYEHLRKEHATKTDRKHNRPLTVEPINDNLMVWAPPVCIEKGLPFAFMENIGDNGEELDDMDAIEWGEYLPPDWESEVVVCANLYLSIDEVLDNE